MWATNALQLVRSRESILQWVYMQHTSFVCYFFLAFFPMTFFKNGKRFFINALITHTHTFDWIRVRYAHPLLSAASYSAYFFRSSSSSLSLDSFVCFVFFFINSISSSQCLIFFVCHSARCRSFAAIYAMRMLSTHARKLWSRWNFFLLLSCMTLYK